MTASIVGTNRTALAQKFWLKADTEMSISGFSGGFLENSLNGSVHRSGFDCRSNDDARSFKGSSYLTDKRAVVRADPELRLEETGANRQMISLNSQRHDSHRWSPPSVRT